MESWNVRSGAGWDECVGVGATHARRGGAERAECEIRELCSARWVVVGVVLSSGVPSRANEEFAVVYEGTGGIGEGKHLVFIASDHEYRGEEALPALARIMAKHYGFKCTVIFGLDPQAGAMLPGSSHIGGLEVLKEAELLVHSMRVINLRHGQLQPCCH